MDINYTAREEGQKGRVFYQNLLASPEYTRKYFPITTGETDSEYLRRPKISIPISSSIVDRITNILFQGAVITSTQAAQERLDELIIDLNLMEFIRDMITNTIVTGQNLALLRAIDGKDNMQVVSLENWDGPWIWLKGSLSGYEYTMRDNLMVPVLSSDVKNSTVVLVDDMMFGNIKHNLPFTPSVLTKNIDKYDDGVWGKSYIARFSDMVVEYNQIVSQISKSIKVLQNIWTTNRDVDNPDNPIRLSPDRINFLGETGVLQQAVRNLDLNEEREYLNILEHQISRTSQVPAELAGLKDAGKLPSGIALQILLQPLVEITERYRNIFIPAIEDLCYKVLYMDYVVRGETPPRGLEVNVQTNNAIFAEDKKEVIDNVVLLKKEGLISLEQAQLLLEPILGIDLTLNTSTLPNSSNDESNTESNNKSNNDSNTDQGGSRVVTTVKSTQENLN